jgi:ribosomal protein S12 methylthiotransferase
LKTKPLNENRLRVGMISLGCAKNLVDSEIMLGALLRDGVEITNDPRQADAVIINTCSFIASAQQESVDAILESAALRDDLRQSQSVIVAGCLPQRFREDLLKLLPEVDGFMGIDQLPQVSQIVREAVQRRRDRLQSQRRQDNLPAAKTRRPAPVIARLAELAAADTTPASATRGSEPIARTAIALPDPGSRTAPVVQINARPVYVPDYATPRFRLTPPHLAYLKIAEGCNHPCSFCAIPRIRGRHRSRALDDILEEARQLLAEGVKEINLISQDTTFYGRDLPADNRRAKERRPASIGAPSAIEVETPRICGLLRGLNALPGDFWIRLLYTHPAHWTDELIQTIADCPKVARYIDIPLQHIHPLMLERMRRETSRAHIVTLLARIRAGIPGVALRTTFIVGFPGETDACFNDLLEFIRETRFERLGVFTYSSEKDTRAAKMANQVPEPVKTRRRAQAMEAQRRISRDWGAAWVGRPLRVLVERETDARQLPKAELRSWEHGLVRGRARQSHQLAGRVCLGRSEADAPDIDGRVYIRGRLPVGNFAVVRITGHSDYDLIGEAGV